MNKEFSIAVLPLMLDILSLAERAADGTNGPAEVERAALRARFDATAALCRGELSLDWELSGYALAAVADELLIVDVPWKGQSWWENHALEVELFGTRRRATEFYARAEKAAALPTGNALQIYVGCVTAGFRGMYRDRPDALDTWLRANGQLIKLSSDRPKLPALGPDVPGAPPLLGKSSLMWAILLTALASATLIVTAWGAWYLT